MSRVVSFVIFISIMLSLAGLVHYYFWVRLVRDLALTTGVTKALTAGVVFLFLLLPSWIWLSRMGDWARPLVWVSLTWAGVMLLVLVTLGAYDLGRGVIGIAQRVLAEAPVDPIRRTVLARMGALGVLLLSGTLSGLALRSGLSRVAIRNVEVKLRRLPQALNGMKIVQLTDVHVGPTIQRAFIEQIVKSANALEADVIAITGDLVDGSVEELREHVAPLADLRARHGVYFVTGNHEYYSGVDEWCQELTRLGIRVLRNERVSIGDELASFDLAGVDDLQGSGFEGHGSDLPRALAGRDPERELVLLAHQPRAVLEAAEHGVGLQLSGHTHGGQIWPWTYLVRLQQPVVSGLARIRDTMIYVSNGTGYWGPPMRLAAPAEITSIKLLAVATA